MLIFVVLALVLHVVLANLAIGLSVTIPILKRRGELELSKKLMKFYASTYGLAGVFGTAFTVFLLSFYPSFIGFVGNVAFYPFAVSILLIVLHFLSIVLYWYGWDRFDPDTHFYVGITMAVTALLIPLGFRAVFGFINVPLGLELHPKPHLDFLKALSNPTFLALYPKSILASLTLTFTLLSSLRREFAKLAVVTLTLTCLAGIIYAETLTAIPYKFENAVSSPIFYAKMAVIALQFLALATIIKTGRGSIMATVCAFLGVALGETLNAVSQYPYAIADVSVLPKEMLGIVNLSAQNPLTSGLEAFTWAFLIPLLIASSILIYLISEPFRSSRTRS